MVPKGKAQSSSENSTSDDNPKTTATLDLHNMPLVDQYYKIVNIECELNLFELHHWLKKNYLDPQDEINL